MTEPDNSFEKDWDVTVAGEHGEMRADEKTDESKRAVCLVKRGLKWDVTAGYVERYPSYTATFDRRRDALQEFFDVLRNPSRYAELTRTTITIETDQPISEELLDKAVTGMATRIEEDSKASVHETWEEDREAYEEFSEALDGFLDNVYHTVGMKDEIDYLEDLRERFEDR